MPTRCIKLRLVVPHRDPSAARDIWTTHHTINDAVTAIERVLLLCRGRAYLKHDGELVAQEEVQRQALAYARAVQQAHGTAGRGSDDHVLDTLHRLYVCLVPSFDLDAKGKPRKGSAQSCRGLARPLMSADSRGYQSVQGEIVEPLPAWVTAWEAQQPDADDVSQAWLRSPEGQAVLHRRRTGRTHGWIEAAKAGRPWQGAFIKHQHAKRAEAAGVAGAIETLRDQLGLLPLFAAPIAGRLAGHRAAVSKWDDLALRLAVGHLLSWESWNHRARADRAAVVANVERQMELLSPYAAELAAVRRYEAQRHEHLKRVASATDDRPYRIGMRALRGWDRVRPRWLSTRCRTLDDRKAVLAELQTRMRGRFGDADLMLWLADDAQLPLWQAADVMPGIARLNAYAAELERRRGAATYTAPSAKDHPRWAQFGAIGDGNIRNYHLRPVRASHALDVELPLLHDTGSGLVEQAHTFRLCPSAQMKRPQLEGPRSRQVTFVNGVHAMTAQLGSADLLLRRRHLEGRSAARLADGEIGAVWLKVALDVQSQAPPQWLNKKGHPEVAPETRHFLSAMGTPSSWTDKLQPGTRVLTVDLGVRSLAGCSVFELVDAPPESSLSFAIADVPGLWARHVRSFLLKLPGETPGRSDRRARRDANAQLRQLRNGLNQLRALLRLSAEASSQQRRSVIAQWVEAQADEARPLIAADAWRALLDHVDDPEAAWAARISPLQQAADDALAAQISQWRRQTGRRQRRAYAGGKSVWAVNHLTDVRRLLVSWSLRARKPGQIRRLNRQQRGTFCARLLRHTNGLKDDRAKTGADLIVQAARGFVPGREGGWMQRHEPCRIILFENLARYRFRTDRPRAENSLLMQWSHRRIVELAKMQGELYGLTVEDAIAAGFSSRYSARTGSPGVRARVLTAEDLADPFTRSLIEDALAPLNAGIDDLTPGCVVPWSGGELFVTLTADGNGQLQPTTVHADLNAAQNLQRRFWTRCAEAYRLNAARIAGEGEAWSVTSRGKRIVGALAAMAGGPAPYTLQSDGDGFRLHSATTGARTRRAVASEADDDAEDAGFDPSGRNGVFFRDPSGVLLPADRWYPQAAFWGRVHQAVGRALIKSAPTPTPF